MHFLLIINVITYIFAIYSWAEHRTTDNERIYRKSFGSSLFVTRY